MTSETACSFLETHRTKPIHFAKAETYRLDRRQVSDPTIKFIEIEIGHTVVFNDVARHIVDELGYPEPGLIGPSALADILYDPDWLGCGGLVVEIAGSRHAWSAAYEVCAELVSIWLDLWPHWRDGRRPFHLVFIDTTTP